MLRLAAALTIAFLLASQAGAQQKASVFGQSKGQIFSARLTIQAEGEKERVILHHPQVDDRTVHIGELDIDTTYRIRSGHLRFGWPQWAAYVTMEGGKEVRRTEATYEPVVVSLKEGQTLIVEFSRSYEPYNGKYVSVDDVQMALVLPRPYWYQDVQEGQFKGKEAYPNSLMFMVDSLWGFGEKRCLKDLATHAAAQIKKGESNEDFRINHLSLNIALDPEGNVKEKLKAMDEPELAALFHKGLTQAWSDMKVLKCYRPFDGQSGAPVALLKKAGFLPADWPDRRTYISLAEALKLAEQQAAKWRQAHPERSPK